MNPKIPLIGSCLLALAGMVTPAHAVWKPFGAKGEAAKNQGTTNKTDVKLQKVDAIFLHGLGGEPSHFPLQKLKKALREKGMELQLDSPWLRPVEIDALGEAHSTGPHTMSDQLERARAAIAKHDGPVILFGHSFGGKAAIALAQEMPDKVKGVVAFAPSVKMLYAYWKNLTGQKGLPDAKTVLETLAKHEHGLRTRLAEIDPGSKEARGIRGALGYHATMTDLALHDETAMEIGMKVPMLMLHGTADDAVSIHYARRFAEANPMVKFVEYAGVHHGMDSEDEKLGLAAKLDMTSKIHDFIASLK